MTETVRVKIVVMTEPDARWVSAGWSGASEDDFIWSCNDNLHGDVRLYHVIEADVPIPSPITANSIEGVVTPLNT